jgi:hypothetical protein
VGGTGLRASLQIGVSAPPSGTTSHESHDLCHGDLLALPHKLLSVQVAHDTALSELWDAYEDELAGVLMPAFGDLRRSVSRDEAPYSRAAAIAALEDDLQIARDHDSTHDERLLATWIHRLAE